MHANFWCACMLVRYSTRVTESVAPFAALSSSTRPYMTRADADLGKLVLVRLVVEDVLVVSDPEDPDEVAQGQRPELGLDAARLEPVVEVIDVLVVSLLPVVDDQHDFGVL